MLRILKVLVVFFVFIALIILISVSFFGVSKKSNQFEFDSYKFEGIFINKINNLDNIFTKDKKDFNVLESENDIEINLKSGVFILDLNDISKRYKIKANGLELDIKGVGDIYIDLNINKNFVFSLNSSFYLKFLDKNKEIINSYFMYPHEWIKFNPKLNFIYKKSDLYRIRTTTKNGYIKESFNTFKKNKIIFESFLGKENILLFENYISNKKKIYNQNNLIYKKIFLLESSKFPFSEYIYKYKKYFINDSKKSAFLQNDIYNNIIILIKQKKQNIELLNKINSDLEELKNIDKNKYNEINLFIKNIYRVFLLKNDISSSIQLENLLYLINNNIGILHIKNYIKLHSIYFNYDFLDFKSFIGYFNLFLKTYLDNSGIVEKNENFDLNKKEKVIELESFVFYLKEYIDSYLFLNNYKDFSSQVNILHKYVLLDKMIYFRNNHDYKKIKTSLKQNIDLLSKLEYFLRNNFFEEKRDKYKKILILNKSSKIKFDDLKNFEKTVKDIFSLFNQNKDKTDFKIDYERLFNLTKEEFLAIKDYEKYKLQYEKELKDIYLINGVGKKENKIYYINDIFLYLSQFNGLSFEKRNIIQKGKYFEIKNVFINNKKYKLNIFPYIGNKVELYDLKTDKFLFLYNLDESKELFLEKYKGAKAEEKYKYDFKNFFSEKLKGVENKNNSTSIDEICALRNLIPDTDNPGKCIQGNTDSGIISVFKKDKLLKEEFITINDFTNIKYENINVKYDGKVYNIKLNNINIKLNVDKIKYELLFDSDYDFKNHEFYNIKYKIKRLGAKDYSFNSSYIYLKLKKVRIENLELILRNSLSYIGNIDNIHSILDSRISLLNLRIEDIFGKIYFKFSTNNKNVIIKVEKNMILFIIIDNINILENSININNLKNYIDKIK